MSSISEICTTAFSVASPTAAAASTTTTDATTSKPKPLTYVSMIASENAKKWDKCPATIQPWQAGDVLASGEQSLSGKGYNYSNAGFNRTTPLLLEAYRGLTSTRLNLAELPVNLFHLLQLSSKKIREGRDWYWSVLTNISVPEIEGLSEDLRGVLNTFGSVVFEFDTSYEHPRFSRIVGGYENALTSEIITSASDLTRVLRENEFTLVPDQKHPGYLFPRCLSDVSVDTETATLAFVDIPGLEIRIWLSEDRKFVLYLPQLPEIFVFSELGVEDVPSSPTLEKIIRRWIYCEGPPLHLLFPSPESHNTQYSFVMVSLETAPNYPFAMGTRGFLVFNGATNRDTGAYVPLDSVECGWGSPDSHFAPRSTSVNFTSAHVIPYSQFCSSGVLRQDPAICETVDIRTSPLAIPHEEIQDDGVTVTVHSDGSTTKTFPDGRPTTVTPFDGVMPLIESERVRRIAYLQYVSTPPFVACLRGVKTLTAEQVTDFFHGLTCIENAHELILFNQFQMNSGRASASRTDMIREYVEDRFNPSSPSSDFDELVRELSDPSAVEEFEADHIDLLEYQVPAEFLPPAAAAVTATDQLSIEHDFDAVVCGQLEESAGADTLAPSLEMLAAEDASSAVDALSFKAAFKQFLSRPRSVQTTSARTFLRFAASTVADIASILEGSSHTSPGVSNPDKALPVVVMEISRNGDQYEIRQTRIQTEDSFRRSLILGESRDITLTPQELVANRINTFVSETSDYCNQNATGQRCLMRTLKSLSLPPGAEYILRQQKSARPNMRNWLIPYLPFATLREKIPEVYTVYSVSATVLNRIENSASPSGSPASSVPPFQRKWTPPNTGTSSAPVHSWFSIFSEICTRYINAINPGLQNVAILEYVRAVREMKELVNSASRLITATLAQPKAQQEYFLRSSAPVSSTSKPGSKNLTPEQTFVKWCLDLYFRELESNEFPRTICHTDFVFMKTNLEAIRTMVTAHCA